jgi:hypothetical protein
VKVLEAETWTWSGIASVAPLTAATRVQITTEAGRGSPEATP